MPFGKTYRVRCGARRVHPRWHSALGRFPTTAAPVSQLEKILTFFNLIPTAFGCVPGLFFFQIWFPFLAVKIRFFLAPFQMWVLYVLAALLLKQTNYHTHTHTHYCTIFLLLKKPPHSQFTFAPYRLGSKFELEVWFVEFMLFCVSRFLFSF